MTRGSFFRSRSLWLGLLGLGFLGWSWVGSMWGTRGVSWRQGDQAVFLAVSDGSVRLGYEGESIRETGFGQWSVQKGNYSYSDDGVDPGWFVAGSIQPYEPIRRLDRDHAALAPRADPDGILGGVPLA